MRRRTLLRLVGAIAVGPLLSLACSSEATSSASPSTAAATARASVAASAAATAARPTGRISVYSALSGSTSDELIKAFRAVHPGIEVVLLPLAAASELQTRIRVEKDSPKADIFVGDDSSVHDALGTEGLLEKYASPNATKIAADAKDPGAFWAGFDLSVFGFVLNADRLKSEIGGAAPRTWDDLLGPAWTQKLVMPDPAKTNAGYVFLATQLFRSGKDEAKAIDYMKKLDPQIAQYVGSASQCIQLVSQGRSVGAPSWSHDILAAKAQSPGIGLAVPENTAFEIGAVSIVRGRSAADLPAARAFVDWILTKPAGELNVKLSSRVSARADVAPPPGAPTLDRVRLVNYDRAFASTQRDRLITAWQQAMGR